MDNTADEFVKTDTGCYFCDLALAHKPTQTPIPDLRSTTGKYDVLMGLSGGVDSSMALHHIVNDLKLRPLCFSIDNGYNDPKADENIMRLVEGMKVPFFRYTIDLKEYNDMLASFMVAGQKNLEIVTDHILMAATFEMANKYGIKTIISGGNWNTESIMPESWGYQPRDLVHIKSVYGKKIKNPTCSLLKFNYYKWIKGIRTVNILDWFDYNREESIKVLEEKYGYQRTGEKHCENIWTWWFQNFYLFEKFNIDKRKAHLSSLILSGQITRDEALSELEKNPVYPELGFEKRVMKYKKRSYKEFKTDEKLWNCITIFIRASRRLLKK